MRQAGDDVIAVAPLPGGQGQKVDAVVAGPGPDGLVELAGLCDEGVGAGVNNNVDLGADLKPSSRDPVAGLGHLAGDDGDVVFDAGAAADDDGGVAAAGDSAV
jgi:hypothetical protein